MLMDALFPVALEALIERWGCAPRAVATYIHTRKQPPWTDEELILMLRCAHRPAREAGAQVFKALMRPLEQKLIRSYRLDAEAARDLRQEAYLALHRQLVKPEWTLRSASLRTYYYTLCLNLLRGQHRKNKGMRTTALEGEDRPQELVDAAPGPLDGLMSAEARAAFARVMEELPARQREALLLRYFEEKDYEEIRAHFGHSSLYATRNLVAAGLKRLGELLEAAGMKPGSGSDLFSKDY